MYNKSAQITITQATLFAYKIPFKSPMRFKEAHLTHREGLILELTDKKNHQHHIEIAPLPGFSQETLSEVTDEIILLLSTNFHDIVNYKSHFKSVQFALDCLRFNHSKEIDDALTCIDNIPLLQGDHNAVIQQYQALNSPQMIKLKVAKESIESDISTFQQLCFLNPLLTIRCDANQAWSQQQAALFFSAIDCQRLDYIEEPTGDHQINLQLADKYQIYLALDETLQRTSFDYQAHPFIKAFIIKPTLVGSKHKIDQLVSLAIQHDILVSFSSSFETIVGLQQLKDLTSHYLSEDNSRTLNISLGIDTLKYFNGPLLKDSQKIQQHCQQLELLWTSN
tara:strand:+ start:9380 stop:10390 length:1011 start_codon:yes stop_codon:yes gene_type:complete